MAKPSLTPRYDGHGMTIDFLIRLLNVSILHISFPFLLLPFLKWIGLENQSFWFLTAGVFSLGLILGHVAGWAHRKWQVAGGGKVEWEDEVVLITGGASGIGYLLAEMLAIRQITVVVLDVNPVKSALDIESYICDISDPKDLARVAKEIREDVGEPTILVNNAGIVHGKSILDLSVYEIKRTMDVNFLGMAWTVKEFLPDMIKNDHGHIFTISSAMGIMTAPFVSDYSASKAAAQAFHAALESELVHIHKTTGIRTTLVCCARVATGMFQGVQERLPFFTPLLEPLQVVREIIEVMEERRGRNQIMLPFFVNFVPLVGILPAWVQDLAAWACGADKAMRTFVGKGKGVGYGGKEKKKEEVRFEALDLKEVQEVMKAAEERKKV